MPSLAATVYRIYTRQELVSSDPSLGYVSDFLQMALGHENNIAQNPKIARALE